MTDPNLNLGIGGGQPPLGPPSSLEDDEKAMKKGRGLVLAVGIILAVLVAIGLVLVLMNVGQQDPYGTIGRQVNLMKRDRFDHFWRCALPEQPLERLRSDADLREAINVRASRNPARYAQMIRGQCMVDLNEHDDPSSLLPPEDLRGQLTALSTALRDLRLGWEEYLVTIERIEGEYDADALDPQLDKVARGWFDYRTAHKAVNDSIRAHQGE
jgi:hypothetical protein